MSSYSRRFVILLPLALWACGFSPTLAPGGAAADLMGKIRVADPGNEDDFNFLQHMETRLGRPDNPAYDLAYTITTNTVGVGVTPQGEIQRYNLTGIVQWTLTRRSDKAVVASSRMQSFTSYSATGTTVAELSAQQNAGERLMDILADQVVAYLQANAASWSQ